AAEVFVPEVALGEDGVGRDRTREAALVEGDAGEDAEAVGLAGREQLVRRARVEDVVEDLHRVEDPGRGRAQGRGRVVLADRDPDEARLARALQAEERVLPAVLVEELVLPDVELEKVDRLRAEVPKALLARAHDVVGREDL